LLVAHRCRTIGKSPEPDRRRPFLGTVPDRPDGRDRPADPHRVRRRCFRM